MLSRGEACGRTQFDACVTHGEILQSGSVLSVLTSETLYCPLGGVGFGCLAVSAATELADSGVIWTLATGVDHNPLHD